MSINYIRLFTFADSQFNSQNQTYTLSIGSTETKAKTVKLQVDSVLWHFEVLQREGMKEHQMNIVIIVIQIIKDGNHKARTLKLQTVVELSQSEPSAVKGRPINVTAICRART